ncbi:MAG: HAD-IB family hydrolase, partial [Gammaproteobacteria bacterium]
MIQRLTLFDLDNTLLRGDSDHQWGTFLIEKGLVDPVAHKEKNDAFYRDYDKGLLDIDAYVKFTLSPVLKMDVQERNLLLAEYLEQNIKPMVLAQGRQLIAEH